MQDLYLIKDKINNKRMITDSITAAIEYKNYQMDKKFREKAVNNEIIITNNEITIKTVPMFTKLEIDNMLIEG